MREPWFFIIVLIVVIAAIVGGVISASRRRKALEEFARRIGFAFSPRSDDIGSAHASYAGFDPFGRGRNPRSANLLSGTRGEIVFELFDYRFTTGSGKNKQTHHYGIVAAQLPMRFVPPVRIRPEGFMDRLASFVGFDDINFESHAFSARYHVSCDDRQFAYQLLHPQAIEFLLAAPKHHWQLGLGVILVHRRGLFKPEEMGQIIEAIEGFVRLIPPFVRQDIEHAPPTGRLM